MRHLAGGLPRSGLLDLFLVEPFQRDGIWSLLIYMIRLIMPVLVAKF